MQKRLYELCEDKRFLKLCGTTRKEELHDMLAEIKRVLHEPFFCGYACSPGVNYEGRRQYCLGIAWCLLRLNYINLDKHRLLEKIINGRMENTWSK